MIRRDRTVLLTLGLALVAPVHAADNPVIFHELDLLTQALGQGRALTDQDILGIFHVADSGVRVGQRLRFSRRALHAWSLRFPYEYGLDTEDPNLFYTSMRELGLSQGIGDRALFVLDTRLQRLPPQLLLIDGELLGHGAAIAVAPSLTWLKAATSAPRRPYGVPAAWISTAVEGNGSGTLATVADRVTDLLDQHGVALQTSAQLPEHLKGAQLAIVAAHGGLADDNRFFTVSLRASRSSRFWMSRR